MIDGYRWIQHLVMSEAIDMEWCEPCKLFHVVGDHKIEPVEPEVIQKEVRLAGLLTNGIG